MLVSGIAGVEFGIGKLVTTVVWSLRRFLPVDLDCALLMISQKGCCISLERYWRRSVALRLEGSLGVVNPAGDDGGIMAVLVITSHRTWIANWGYHLCRTRWRCGSPGRKMLGTMDRVVRCSPWACVFFGQCSSWNGVDLASSMEQSHYWRQKVRLPLHFNNASRLGYLHATDVSARSVCLVCLGLAC